MRRIAILSGMLAALSSCSAQAAEETIRIEAEFVDMSGAPLPQLPVRIAVGGARAAREPAAGLKLTTDAQGRVLLEVVAPVKSRRVSLDNSFVRHQARFLEIGVELELRGQPALYWVELDHVKEGTLGVMHAYVAGAAGRFDEMLAFHPETHSWSIPGDPQGLLMSSTGAELRFHEMEEAAGKGWTVRLTIEKHVFTIR